MAASFKKLKQLEGASSTGTNMVNQLFSSHPQLEKRIDRMEKKCKKDGYDLATLAGKTQADYNKATTATASKSSKTSKSTKSGKSGKSSKTSKTSKSTKSSKSSKTSKSSKNSKK